MERDDPQNKRASKGSDTSETPANEPAMTHEEFREVVAILWRSFCRAVARDPGLVDRLQAMKEEETP